jgi:outer membrane lipoprotein-sorting protein
MNAKTLITAVALTAAFGFTGSAFAIGSDDAIHYQTVQSAKTRAEVQAELTQAYQNGDLRKNEYINNAQQEAVSTGNDSVRAANSPRIENLYIGG